KETYNDYMLNADTQEEEDWGEMTEAESLDTLWTLGYQDSLDSNKRRWVVWTEVDSETHFIDAEGNYCEDPDWFDTDAEARKAHENYLDSSSSNTSTADEDDFASFSQRWSGKYKHEEIAPHLTLKYEYDLGSGDKKWCITAEIGGKERFLNPDFEYQDEEFWFDTEKEAKDAYTDYIDHLHEARLDEEEGGKTERMKSVVKRAVPVLFLATAVFVGGLYLGDRIGFAEYARDGLVYAESTLLPMLAQQGMVTKIGAGVVASVVLGGVAYGIYRYGWRNRNKPKAESVE
ncbi:MAG: hypothetical protein SXQ77_02105, partial [Halobacteria archaeon]|nr:hypothetical protein [Halobacteria archaeon]